MSSTEDAEQKVGAHLRGWRYLQMDTERRSLSCSISNEYMSFSPSRSAVQLVVEAADSATAERLLRFPSIPVLVLTLPSHTADQNAGCIWVRERFRKYFLLHFIKASCFDIECYPLPFVYRSAHKTCIFGTAFHIPQDRPCGGLCCLQLHTLHGAETYEWMF